MLLFLLLLVSVSFSGQVIVAKVDGHIITKEEFEKLFRFYWKEMLHFSPKRYTFEDKKLFLLEYVKGLIVEDVADRMNLKVSDEEVMRRLRQWGRKKPDPRLVELVRRELLLETLENKLVSDSPVTEGEIEAYYLLNKREFYYPNQVKLLRVVVDSKKRALRVYRLLKRGELPVGEKGVVVGRERWYSLQALPKKVRRRLYPYRVGVVSRPIKLETGYLLLKITDKRKAGIMPLSEVKEQVRRKLLRIKKQEVLKEWFREVLKGYNLELYLKALE
ncbi:peptidyl-prolyl cis-trans isomerase [Hydrogenivirga sp.]